MRALRSADQPGLFHPRATTPLWTKLPAEVRQQTLALLARLLRSHRRDLFGGKQAQEVRDE